LDYIERKKQELGLTAEETRLQHARVFANIIAQFADDQRIDDRERRKLNRLHKALSRLGWAPGE
jgi:DNA invertase Pin-like site-specific DNA recombinase